jgi:hypothetical protein
MPPCSEDDVIPPGWLLDDRGISLTSASYETDSVVSRPSRFSLSNLPDFFRQYPRWILCHHPASVASAGTQSVHDSLRINS